MVCLGLLVYLFETNMLALTGIIYLPLSLGTGNELLGLGPSHHANPYSSRRGGCQETREISEQTVEGENKLNGEAPLRLLLIETLFV